MTTIYVEVDTLGRVDLQYSYEAGLIDLIKRLIPGNRRTWIRETKTWRVDSLLAATRFLNAVYDGGQHNIVCDDSVSERLANSRRAATAPVVRAVQDSPEDVFDSLLRIVEVDREDKVFEALTRVLHPDMTTGSLDLMQSLNRVCDRREGRNCRPGSTTSGSTR